MYIEALRYDEELEKISLKELSLIKVYEKTCSFRAPAGEIVTFLLFPNRLVPGGIVCDAAYFEAVKNMKSLDIEKISGQPVSLSLPKKSNIPVGSAEAVKRVWREIGGISRELLEKLVREKRYGELVGLGPGLTPAGDDILVGLIAAGKMSGAQNIRNVDYSRTTELSGHFLKKAFKGKFSDCVINFIESGDLSILGFGATSGAATALGILEGLRIVNVRGKNGS